MFLFDDVSTVIFPACAGVNLKSSKQARQLKYLSRICGSDPCSDAVIMLEGDYMPAFAGVYKKIKIGEKNMYITRIEINRNNRRKMKDLTHLGAYHNWVERAFPDEFKQKIRTRKLWRIDKVYDREYLILLSESKPNITLLEEYGVPNTAIIKCYSDIINNLSESQTLRFKLEVHPTKSIMEKNSKRGKLKVCNTVESQIQYLLDKSKKHGFEINSINIDNTTTKELFKNKEKINLKSVTYSGILTISNKNHFVETLLNGIGRKKAYGFGLLSIA